MSVTSAVLAALVAEGEIIDLGVHGDGWHEYRVPPARFECPRSKFNGMTAPEVWGGLASHLDTTVDRLDPKDALRYDADAYRFLVENGVMT